MGATAHLGIKFGEYDSTIASLIPHYRPLLAAAAEAVDVVARTAPAVVDLGTGSGALAAEILKVRPKARLIGIDSDESMLDAAIAKAQQAAAQRAFSSFSFPGAIRSRALEGLCQG